MNYEEVRLSPRQITIAVGKSAALGAVIAYLFYESIWMLLLVFPLLYLELRLEKTRTLRRTRMHLEEQFCMALKSMGESLYAGYSIENAVTSCRRELEHLYGKEAELCREFRCMESQMKVNAAPEKLLRDLGVRSGVTDIRNFASIFHVARRTGGNLGQVVRMTARMVEDKQEAKKEIEATLAARKAEQQIMSGMPAGILFYLKLTSPGYLSVLYESALGRIFMTVCLGVYVGAYLLGKRMVEIEV